MSARTTKGERRPNTVVARDLPEDAHVAYVTDAEGNLGYLRRVLSATRGVSFSASCDSASAAVCSERIILEENCFLVFGGDVVDKFTEDIQLVKILLQAHRDYPGRVFFILGNRDVNKLRFMSELDEQVKGTTIEVYWDSNAKSYASYLESKQLQDTKVNQLKWMLECTMGCAETFEFRRTELAKLSAEEHSTEVTDTQVLESFRKSVNPSHGDPWMLNFIERGQFALRLGPYLFVHGALLSRNVGKLPHSDEIVSDLDTWLAGFDSFLQTHIAAYRENPLFQEDGTRNGEAILDYVVPRGGHDRTIVYADYTVDGNATPLDSSVVAYLQQNSVSVVVSGHKPHGDCPTVIRHSLENGDSVIAITCDTSYSKFSSPDRRGNVFAAVECHFGHVEVHGELLSGVTHRYQLHWKKDAEFEPFSLIGRQLQDDSWVKTVLMKDPPDQPVVLAGKGEGFKMNIRELGVDETRAQLK
mmetsp:Transcript_41154/g.103771  ORF Transcript_41154/g.103771 Transcript_41154/m.103771 type:complete len:472 (+) Transcript_41154:90-1505(+)